MPLHAGSYLQIRTIQKVDDCKSRPLLIYQEIRLFHAVSFDTALKECDEVLYREVIAMCRYEDLSVRGEEYVVRLCIDIELFACNV